MAGLPIKARREPCNARFFLFWIRTVGSLIVCAAAGSYGWAQEVAGENRSDPGLEAEKNYDRGRALAYGIGVSRNYDEAVKLLTLAADSGLAVAKFELALRYLWGQGVLQSTETGLRLLRGAAGDGYVFAQTFLGDGLQSGLVNGSVPVEQNLPESVYWFREAAGSGDVTAYARLGSSYESGLGVKKDIKEALRWYRKAAEQGDARGQASIGALYAKGEGVPKDEVEALAWMNIAAASGYDFIVADRDRLERRVGREMTLIAQQRSKGILKEIEIAKSGHASTEEGGPTGPGFADEDVPKTSGTGTVVSKNGYVLTAAHVVAGGGRVKVLSVKGLKPATVMRVDEANDLAIIQVAESDLNTLPVAPSRGVRLGQSVATIGFPNITIQGFSPKVTRGEISSLNGIGDDPRSWQISAPVQAGNSGGPLLDASGNLIGIVVSKLGLKAAAATGDLPQNVNYAVKSAYALALLEPYLDASEPEPIPPGQKQSFEDMVAKAQQSVVLILAY
jgi:S1-C subfamily serine protease